MAGSNPPPNVIIPVESDLFRAFQRLAEHQRIVFFAGLPGVGKSLLAQQLAHLAHATGRQIHLLQWDTARPAFETDAVLARYPEVDGATHSVIRKAVGLWARNAVSRWHESNPDSDSLLIGETPLIGNRLIELVRPHDDSAETLLTDERTLFVVPVPSREVRRLIEDSRRRRSSDPQHERERADAIPRMMRELWQELYRAAHELGVVDSVPQGAAIDYDPLVYSMVYEKILTHRRSEIVPVDVVLSTVNQSVYDFDIPTHDVVPDEDEALAYIEEVESLYPDQRGLEQETRDWHII